MRKISCCIVLVLIAIASAQEPDCRPEGRPNMEKLASCCKTPLLIEQSIVAKCVDEFKPTKCLIYKCALTAAGILNNNKMDKEAAIKYVTTRAKGDEKILSLLTTSLDTCLTKAAAKEADFAQILSQAPEAEKACVPSVAFLTGCMFMHRIISCPAWTNDAECNAIKAHTEKCPRPH